MPILLEHKEILSKQSKNKTLSEWIDYFNLKYTKNQIYNYCYRNNYPIKKLTKEEISKKQSQNARKYYINQDYFKTWSRNMAYILGLWFADGCIYGGKMFDITLHNKDKYMLEKIAKEFNFEGKIYNYIDRNASRLNFSCVSMYKDLIALGGKENKSLTINFPNIPEKYLSDFIRGYFDGDGSIMHIKNNRINTAFTCGSKKFLDSLVNILKSQANIEGGSYDKSCVSYKFGKKDSIKIGNYIYKDNPELFLLRKREKFGSLICV